MRTKNFFFILSAMLLTSVCAFAQSGNQPLKGDVNEDGKVDVSDIVAVVNIILNGGSTPQPAVTYYWYVGQDHPSENTTIVTDNNSPGWRLTGSTIDADYEFNTTDNGISDNPTRREEWYIALPVGSPYHIWDDGYTEQFDTYYATSETVEFNNVTYNIFKPGTSARILGGQLIKK